VLDERVDSVVDLIYREVNEAFERQSGVPQDVVGKRVSEVFRPISNERRDTFTRVYRTGEGKHIERYSTETDRWYSLHYARVGPPGSLLQSIVFEDITERRSRERQRGVPAEAERSR
jgi:PAS domain-containing protein